MLHYTKIPNLILYDLHWLFNTFAADVRICLTCKSGISHLPQQQHNSCTDYARELFKPSKDSACLLVCTRKNVCFFLWVTPWGRFLAILAHFTWPRAQPLDGSISLKFSLETSLESWVFWALDQLSSISGSKVII